MRSALHRRLSVLSRTAFAGFLATGALAAHAETTLYVANVGGSNE